MFGVKTLSWCRFLSKTYTVQYRNTRTDADVHPVSIGIYQALGRRYACLQIHELGKPTQAWPEHVFIVSVNNVYVPNEQLIGGCKYRQFGQAFFIRDDVLAIHFKLESV